MQPYLGCSNYFIVRSEYELSKGYADFYLQPDLVHLLDMSYSFLLEVKYVHRGESDVVIQEKIGEAAAQLRSYAGDGLVGSTKGLRLCAGWSLFGGGGKWYMPKKYSPEDKSCRFSV